jgi:NAD(P)-dependent dehydrogenase (short-subunit alcohol dehydrogenase family)
MIADNKRKRTMGRVSGKIALVTGGANGIGRGCALALAREGASVVVTDLASTAGRACAAEIEKAGGVAMFLEHDTTSEDAWVSVIAQIKARFGKLHILVNNAGIAVPGPITETSLADWRKQQAVNVEGVFLGVKHALPLMRESGGGSIINMSSVAGLKGSANLSSYCASKGAVRLFTKAAALECAAARDGVRVNSVHPGIIETAIWDAIGAGVGGAGVGGAGQGGEPGANRLDLDAVTAVATPLGVKGFPEDIAEGVVYLASDESRYVTGAELVIDGGMCAR